MAELTSLQAASAIDHTVRAVMREVVLPQIRQQVIEAVEARMADAVKYVIGTDIKSAVTEAVRAEVAGRLKVSVEVVEPDAPPAIHRSDCTCRVCEPF